MSPTIAALPAQPKNPRGKRIPGKPGRFSPDRPFHMSTRRGGNKSVSGSAPSANGSAEDFESRRESFDAERPVTANSNGTQASKGTYASDFSPPQPIPDIDMVEAPTVTVAEDNVDSERKSRSRSRVDQTSPSTLKRKRVSPSPPPAVSGDDSFEAANDEDEAQGPDNTYDSDNVSVLRQDELSDREDDADDAAEREGDSAGSSQSQEVVPAYDAMAGTSVDVTPMLSEQASPATTGSAEEDEGEDETAIAKPLAAALNEVAKAKKAEPAEPAEPADVPMLNASQAMDDADEVEEQVRTDEEGRMVVRRGRFGGRRRAQHPNPAIETAMRRQAHLKSAFRAIARAQKNILAEVTQREIDSLESEPTYYAQPEAHEQILQGLNERLEKRKAAIQAQHDMRLKHLKVTLDGERDAVVKTCRQQLDDIEESRVDQLQYEFLRIARNAQKEDGNETEDEDEVIPRLKRTAYHFKRGAGLEPVFDSRSRLAIETQRATEDMQARYNMYEMMKELPDDEKPEKRKNFTIMDERPRTAASKVREGQDNLEMLAAASEETERRANIPIIPNEQALGLKLLSDLASRPSIVGGRSQSSESIGSHRASMSGHPQLHLQVPSTNSPIQVQMSPRTQHAMGNRFEPGQMPPPSTPRHDAGLLNRLSEPRWHERQASTPNKDERPAMAQIQPLVTDTARSPGRFPSNETDSLRNRIASRDGQLQDSLFGSSRPSTEISPALRLFDMFGGPRRRAASHSDPAPPFGNRSDAPVGGQREQREPAKDVKREPTRSGSTVFDPIRSATTRWPDQPSEAGAANGHMRDATSPKSELFSLGGTPGQQSSSAVSDQTSQHNKKNSKTGNFTPKTNLQQRGGKSRKQAAKEKKQHHQQPLENGRPESAGTPTMAQSSYSGSPGFAMRPPSPWLGRPPLRSPYESGPPSGPFNHHGGPYGPQPGFPPPLSHMPQRASLDLSSLHHRDRFATPFGPPAGGPFFPSIPHHQQPPPPGVAPDHWRQQINPPTGPPGFPGRPPPPPGLPQGPPHTPQTPHPHSASGPGFGGMARGQPLAPAGGSSGPGPFRPANNHPPAFAQQQQQHGGSHGGSRRRALSDAGGGFAKFLPLWEPPTGKRKG